MQTDIERKSVFMLMPCQTERAATLWHHLLIMRQDCRNALGMNQTMLLLAGGGLSQRSEWVLPNYAACARGVWRERGAWMDLFVYWCLCFCVCLTAVVLSGLFANMLVHERRQACRDALAAETQEQEEEEEEARERLLTHRKHAMFYNLQITGQILYVLNNILQIQFFLSPSSWEI